MFEEDKFLIRRRALSQSAVRALIEDRFYEGYLADIENPQYPCANFSFRGGSFTEGLRDASTKMMTMWAWSSQSRSQASQVMDAVGGALHREPLRGDSVNMVCFQQSPPLENYDETEKVYYVATEWVVRELS